MLEISWGRTFVKDEEHNERWLWWWWVLQVSAEDRNL